MKKKNSERKKLSFFVIPNLIVYFFFSVKLKMIIITKRYHQVLIVLRRNQRHIHQRKKSLHTYQKQLRQSHRIKVKRGNIQLHQCISKPPHLHRHLLFIQLKLQPHYERRRR